MTPANRLLTFLLLLLVFASAASAIDRETLRWIRNKPPIREIEITGNRHFEDGEIESQMYSSVRTFWAALKGERTSRIQRETLGRDTIQIKYMYLREGFLGIQVDEEFELIEPDSAARVRVRVNEGRRFLFEKVYIEGDFWPGFQDDLEDFIDDFKSGKPIDYFEVMQAGFDMKTVFANNGYPYATVKPNIDTVGNDTNAVITYRVRQDSVVHFGDVTITGLSNYPTYTARRELKFKPGDVYRRRDIVDSQRRLFESGYFTTLRLVEANNQQDKYSPDFMLNVRERKTRYVTLTTGAGQSQAADLTWSFTGGVGKRNLFGSRRIDLSGLIEFSLGADSRITDHKYRIRYTEPWFLGIRMPLSLAFEFEPERRHVAQDFRVQQWAISLSSNRRFGRRTEILMGAEYQQVDIGGVPDEIEENVRREVEGLSIRRRLYLTAVRDNRDDLLVPTTGSVREIYSEYFGGFLGGDDHFYKIQASWSIYRQVWPGWIGASRLRAGYAESFGASDLVPSEDRLFLGGANTIRGFGENSLAPTLADDLPGANFTIVANQEFRWRTLQVLQVLPLIKKLFANLPLWQTVFFDMGNAYRGPEEFKFENLALAYGTGIQIISPAGPIRIDYARRIKTKTISFEDRWHFTILFAF